MAMTKPVVMVLTAVEKTFSKWLFESDPWPEEPPLVGDSVLMVIFDGPELLEAYVRVVRKE